MKRDRIGEVHLSREGYEFEIINYKGRANCDIMFKKDNILLKGRQYRKIINKDITHPLTPTIFDIAFIGVGIYKAYENNKITRPCSFFHSIIRRGYDIKHKQKRDIKKYLLCLCLIS